MESIIVKKKTKKVKFKLFRKLLNNNSNNSNNSNNRNINNIIHTDAANIPKRPTLKPSLHSVNSLGNNKPVNKTKPKLKYAKSADETNNRSKQLKDRNVSCENKCCTEMNALHPCKAIWRELNLNNKCNSNIMAIEAASKCSNNSKCIPCKRIEFILSNLNNNITDDTLSDNKLSDFMSDLPGYSHIGLSKDFRHLQIFHVRNGKKNVKIDNNNNNVDYSDTKSLIKYIYKSLSKYDINMNMNMKIKEERDNTHIHNINNINNTPHTQIDILQAVSKFMMELQTKKDFNNKYIKLGLISKGANGKIYAVKSWSAKDEFYAMKEICFKNLNINILYEILRNWRMVIDLKLLGNETEIFVDSNKSIFLIVQHLYKGSMCELLKETYLKKRRCLTENELKIILSHGIINTLQIMHNNGYIHGDIKPENLVYEQDKKNNNKYKTAIIDYDLCTKYNIDDNNNNNNNNNGVLSEWRGTLGYSAPEWSPYKRIKSIITPKVDIYSLGLTMLILLCGEQPFLCPTAVKQKLEKEDPTINIKQFVYQTMINNGQFMIKHFLNQIANKISPQLFQLLTIMLKHNVHERADIKQIINHPWFNDINPLPT